MLTTSISRNGNYISHSMPVVLPLAARKTTIRVSRNPTVPPGEREDLKKKNDEDTLDIEK